MGVSFRF